MTKEVLNLGFIGRACATSSNGDRSNNVGHRTIANDCSSRTRTPSSASSGCVTRPTAGSCRADGAALRCGSGSTTATDYWPNVLYDPREGMLRDDSASCLAPAGAPTLRRTPASSGAA